MMIMKTVQVTASPAAIPGFSSENTPPPADNSPRHGRSLSRTYLDVFNPPLDIHNGISPGSSPSVGPTSSASISRPGQPSPTAVEITCSVCTIPNSFHSESREMPSSPPANGSPSLNFKGLPASPALNFRKTRSNASLTRELDDFHLGETLSSPGCGAGTGILHHHHHHHAHYHRAAHPPSHSPLISSLILDDRKMSVTDIALTQEDLDATATTEEVLNPHLLHKHINSYPSSPPVPERKGSVILDLAEHLPTVVPIEETTISSSIPLYEMPADMLLPLLDRPNDVKKLVNHPCRTRFIQILKNSLGDEIYEQKLLKLWLETDRSELSDAEWLWKTKSIILQRPGAGSSCRDGKLWGDFCDMVGWDEDDLSIDYAGPAEDRRIGTPVEAMGQIAEGDEEEDKKL